MIKPKSYYSKGDCFMDFNNVDDSISFSTYSGLSDEKINTSATKSFFLSMLYSYFSKRGEFRQQLIDIFLKCTTYIERHEICKQCQYLNSKPNYGEENKCNFCVHSTFNRVDFFMSMQKEMNENCDS